MAEGVRQALTVADLILVKYQNSKTRLWLPRLNWAWLGIALPTVYMDQHTESSDDARMAGMAQHETLTTLEAQQGMLEHQAYFDQSGGWADGADKEMNSDAAAKKPNKKRKCISSITLNPLAIFLKTLAYIWSLSPVLSARLVAASFYRKISGSVHMQIAFKHALGVGLLCIPAFLPTESSGHKWFVDSHGQWMIISYCWVLDVTTGATWRIAYLRLVSTESQSLGAPKVTV